MNEDFLQGRATIEMNVSLKEVRNKGKFTGNLTIVVDGYNAPVTAGNFVDLVDKKFYDGMEIQRADGFIVQTGDPGDDVHPPPSLTTHTHTLPLCHMSDSI